MTSIITLKVSEDFSKTPGPRLRDEGLDSGEEFRYEILASCLGSREFSKIIIDLDGTAGYAGSFLDEAFGGLVYEDGWTYCELSHLLEFKSEEEPYLIAEIWECIKDADQSRSV